MNQTTERGRPDGSLSKAGGTIEGGGRTGGRSRRAAGGGEKSRRLRSSSGGPGRPFLRGGENPLCLLTGGSRGAGRDCRSSRKRGSGTRGDRIGESSGRFLFVTGAGAVSRLTPKPRSRLAISSIPLYMNRDAKRRRGASEMGRINIWQMLQFTSRLTGWEGLLEPSL
jgi:hypothetical protein